MPESARTNVQLTLAINGYDHMRDVVSGRVAVESSSGRVVRLFGDYRAVEEAYYRESGVFPIIHGFAIRSDRRLAPEELFAPQVREAFRV